MPISSLLQKLTHRILDWNFRPMIIFMQLDWYLGRMVFLPVAKTRFQGVFSDSVLLSIFSPYFPLRKTDNCVARINRLIVGITQVSSELTQKKYRNRSAFPGDPVVSGRRSPPLVVGRLKVCHMYCKGGKTKEIRNIFPFSAKRYYSFKIRTKSCIKKYNIAY